MAPVNFITDVAQAAPPERALMERRGRRRSGSNPGLPSLLMAKPSQGSTWEDGAAAVRAEAGLDGAAVRAGAAASSPLEVSGPGGRVRSVRVRAGAAASSPLEGVTASCRHIAARPIVAASGRMAAGITTGIARFSRSREASATPRWRRPLQRRGRRRSGSKTGDASHRPRAGRLHVPQTSKSAPPVAGASPAPTENIEEPFIKLSLAVFLCAFV
jgi:hypothetical protein